MLTKLAKLATLLDSLKLTEQADLIDQVIEKFASIEDLSAIEPTGSFPDEYTVKPSSELDYFLREASIDELAEILLDSRDRLELEELIQTLQES